MAILGPKPWVNPFGKMSIFRLLELLVFIAYKGALSFQIIVKVNFLTNIALKKRVGKMAIFGPKPWVNPFAKMSIFRLLELFVFIAQKGAFSFQIIVKVIFLTNIALQKRLEKWPYLDQNHGLTLLEKCQFFDFWNFLFLLPRKAFFHSRISKKLFCRPKLWVNPFGKTSIFRHFELVVFIAQKGVFSSQNIVKVIFLTNIV